MSKTIKVNHPKLCDCKYPDLDLENSNTGESITCALPKLRKLIEERNEMIEALMDVRHSIEDAKTNNGSVILGDHCEKKVIQALKNTGKL